MSKKALLLVVAVILFLNLENVSATNFEWWNSSWHYRVGIIVNTSTYNRTNWPVEYPINFSSLGINGTFDNNSIRVIEYYDNGSIKDSGSLNEGILSQFDEYSNYDANGNAIGEVVWLLSGNRTENTLYYYYIYFDTIENGKSPPNYTTELSFVNKSGEEFWVNTSKLEIKVDTYNHLNRTAGMYFAKLRDTGEIIFNAPTSQLPIEYIRYYSSVSGEYYEYDFRKNFRVISDGPIRKIIEQEGDEILWGSSGETTPQYTNKGNMTKRYVFYEDNQWIKIEQRFTANDSISRGSGSYTTALALDTGRSTIGTPTPDKIQGTTTEPYSYYSIFDNGLGIGVINLNKSGGDYYANKDSNTRIGIYLSSKSLSKGDTISDTAVIYFNDIESHEPILELRNRLINNIIITQGNLESWSASVEVKTDYPYYNRNETALITVNITEDNFNQTSSVNATLDMGTTNPNDDITLVLYDDGTHGDQLPNDNVYSNTYTFQADSVEGNWTITAYVYNSNGQVLNTTTTTFYLSKTFNIEIIFWPPTYNVGLVNQTTFRANVTVQNYRNDTKIFGNLYCEYYNSSEYTKVTEVDNISFDSDNGVYYINYSSPSEVGVWNLTCNLTKSNNTGTSTVNFTTYQAENTTLETSIVTNTTYIDGITQNDNQSFDIQVNVTNTGLGSATSVNITISFSSAGWSTNYSDNKINCPDLFPGSSPCIKDIRVTAPAATSPGNYTINATAEWMNFDGNESYSQDTLTVEVLQNPVINIVQDLLYSSIQEGTSGSVGTFTVESIGNYKVEEVYASCGSGVVCSEFNVTLYPDYFASINPAASESVEINVTIPEGYPPGNYSGIVEVNSSDTSEDGRDTIILSVEVPESRTWTLSREICEDAAPPNKTGEIFNCEVEINNTGNVPINFSITSSGNGSAYLFPNETTFIVENSSTHLFNIQFDTQDANAGNTYVAVFTVDAIDAGSIPTSQNISVYLRVELGPLIDFEVSPQLIEQNGSVTIKANLTDRIGKGIEWVKANITDSFGNIHQIDLYNDPENSSNWTANYQDTLLRGNYTIVVYSQDSAGGWGESDAKNFSVFAKLRLTVLTSSTIFEPDDSGSMQVNVTDLIGEPIEAATAIVDILLNNESGNHFGLDGSWPKYLVTSSEGISSTSFKFTGVEGFYYWSVDVNYTDIGQNVFAYDSGVFFVGSLSVDTSAGDLYYPGENVTILSTVLKDNQLFQVDYLTVTVSLDNTILYEENSTLIPGPAYKSEYTLPNNATSGTYIVTATAYYGPISSTVIDTFTVLEGGALQFDLYPGGPYRAGDTVSVKGEIKNADGQYLDGANVSLLLKDPDGNIIYNATFTDVVSPSKIADIPLDINATPGTYRLEGTARYGASQAEEIVLFDVYQSLFVKIGVQPTYYLSTTENVTMEITVQVLDAGTGLGVEPDSLTLVIRNSTYDVWRRLEIGNMTKVSDGLYRYTEDLNPSNTAVDSYLAFLEVKVGTMRAWDIEVFRIKYGVTDIRFAESKIEINKGDNADFTILLTYFGDPNIQDLPLTYTIVGTSYSYTETVKNPPPGVELRFERNFTNVELDPGEYTLRGTVIYDPEKPPAVAEIPLIVSGGAAEVLPPPIIGGGGGGGVTEEEEILKKTEIKIEDIHPEEILLERGGWVYLVATVNNSGTETLHSVEASLTGIPEDWYEMIKYQTSELLPADIFDVLIEIKVPQNASPGPRILTVKVVSTEATDEKDIILRIFDSKQELFEFEIDAANERLRTVERRVFKAISEGKNVSNSLDLLDKAANEIFNAEEYLKNGEYPKVLESIERCLKYIDQVNSILDKATPVEVVKVVPTETPTPTPETPYMWIGITAFFFILTIGLVVYFGMKWYKKFESFAEKTAMRIGPPRKVEQKPAKKSKPSTTIPQNVPPKMSDELIELRREKERIKKLLETLKKQHSSGMISRKTYTELRKKNQEKLRKIEEKIKELS